MGHRTDDEGVMIQHLSEILDVLYQILERMPGLDEDGTGEAPQEGR